MSAQDSADLVRRYYAAFNAGDMELMLSMLDEAVVHDISQGGRQIGRAAFAGFMAHMNRCYAERLTDLVVMVDAGGGRAAAEFTVHGTYLQTDPDLPEGTAPARGQSYILPAGAFFDIMAGRIARVSTHYNLRDWLTQVA
jgi:steroid delta-isomerase-like uncharacterized protein